MYSSDRVVHSSANSNVPPELTDRIIDFLHNDWESLKSCSLTCKAWLPASRYHLWHRVVLRYNNGDEKDYYTEFLKSSPVVTSCIVDLTVEFTANSGPDSNRPAELDWINETLLPIFSTLRFLRQLMFVNARFDEDDLFLGLIAPKLSSLHALHISLCSFSKFSQYVELVWCSPLLETLRLDNVAFDYIDKYIPRPMTVARPKLKFLMLIFYSSHMPTVIDWLISESVCSSLDFLVVFQLQVESPAVTRLLPAIGSHLRHLSVSYAFLPTQPGAEKGKSSPSPRYPQSKLQKNESLNTQTPNTVSTENSLFPTISHCTDLRTLNFLFAGPNSLSIIPLIISQINSPHVEEIDLGLTDIFSPDDLDTFDWPSLWKSLTAKKFSRLKSVRFMVPAAASKNSFFDTKECITQHLIAVDTMGLIKVESISPDHGVFPTSPSAS